MPTELEELVEFLHHGNTTIRQTAAEHLVPYSRVEPSVFKRNQLAPVKDLKLLVKDYTPIAKNALTILINITKDQEVLQLLDSDDAFLESLLVRITNAKEPTANEIAMLLANMAKSDKLERIFTLKRSIPQGLSASPIAIDQLLDCFVKGAKGSLNKHADFDYLAYLFADLAKFPAGATHLTTPSASDSGIYPLAKLLPFTTHSSLIRRLGIASCIKNTSFLPSLHPTLLSPTTLKILPYLLLPLAAGTDTYTDHETDQLLDELQYLDEKKEREGDVGILKTHLETLLLLTTERDGRDALRAAGCYFVVRECHLAVEDEGVREECERLVQVIMRDEEGEERGSEVGEMHELERRSGETGVGGRGKGEAGRMVTQANESDEDEQIVEIF